LRARVATVDGHARIEFGERSVSGRLSIAPPLEFIAGRERFRIRDLPGGLSSRSKVVLVRRLIQEGLLKPVRTGA